MLAPLFEEMSQQECEDLLVRMRVGRLAFALHDAVDVVPLGFHFEQGWIYGRTSPGGKLATLDRNRRVAFEVDEFGGPFEWKSVVIHGSFYLLDPDSDEKAKKKLERLFPDAFSGTDPVSFRNQFFGISIEQTVGRSAKPTSGQKKPVVQQTRPEPGPDPTRDAQLRQAVVAEIARVGQEREKNVRTGVEDGVVILTGTVSNSRLRSDLDTAIAALPGVRGIAQELDVEWPIRVQRTSAEVALEAANAVERLLPDGANHVVVVFENGWIRLEGNASADDRQRLLSSLQHIAGSRGVIDRLKDTTSS